MIKYCVHTACLFLISQALLAADAKQPDLPRGERAWPEPAEADVQKILAALPDKSEVTPKQPRKLLIFYRADNFPHACIPYWNKLLVELGRKTGAYTPVLSQSYADLSTTNLQGYDAIFMNNTTRLNAPAEARTALQEFVKSGKGLAGNHGAGDNWHDWPEGREMMGCEFVTHPFGRVKIKIDDKTSPLTALFEGNAFWFSDEIYAFKEPYSREKLHVLLSVDYANTPDVAKAEERLKQKAIAPDATASDKAWLAAARPDHDYGIAWIRKWGQGRVFYCSLGHRNEVTWDPTMVRFFLAGIQYAIGDLKACDTPSVEAASWK